MLSRRAFFRWPRFPLLALVATLTVFLLPLGIGNPIAAGATDPTGATASRDLASSATGDLAATPRRASKARLVLKASRDGRRGGSAMKIRTRAKGPVRIHGRKRLAHRTPRGTRHTLRAWVRAGAPGQRATLVGREVLHGSTLQKRSRSKKLRRGTWVRINVPVRTRHHRSTFGIKLLVSSQRPGKVKVDDVVVVIPPEPVSAAPEPEPSDLTAQTAVRVFPHYADKTYGNHEAVLDTLGRLGVKRISAQLGPNMRADELAFYQAAHSRYGIKVWFAVGVPGDVLTDAQWASIRDLLTGPLAGIAELASGWNEPNHRVSGDWTVPTAAHQNRLWDNIQQVNGQSGQDIAVGTPPLWSGNFSEQFADLAALAPKIAGSYDTINWHMYPHGKQGAELEALIDRQVAEFTTAYGDFPMVNSESGYFTAENYTGGSNPSTEKEQAAQVDDLILFHAERGIGLSLFELLDDPDPTGTNREAHFGLVRTSSLDPSTWSDKPAFAVVRDLLTR